jgi:dTDP-4-amino-4,6-dideoxygalactose transaminase
LSPGMKSDIARAKMLALHGMSKDAWKRFSDDGYKHYYVVECGFKYNMMDIQAAIGLHQLARVEENWKKRQAVWDRYQAAFSDLTISRPKEAEPGTRHAYHLYTILVDQEKCKVSRDEFLDAILEYKIGVGVHYLSIPEHPYYQQTFGWKPEDYPEAMRIGRQTISLPLSAALTYQDVDDVIAAVHEIVGNG